MSNNELLDKIKVEIERRYKEFDGKTGDIATASRLAYLDVISFLSTLESEKPMNQEGLEEEIHEYNKERFDEYFPEQDGDFISEVDFMTCLNRVARHFAQWGAEHLADERKMMGDSSEITNHLNYLVDYARRQVEELLDVIKKYDDYSDEQIEELRTHLMAMFLEGAGWQKKQMLKEAMEGTVMDFSSNQPRPQVDVYVDPNKYCTGDKVRIIVCKNEDEKWKQ